MKLLTERLRAIVGADGVITSGAALATYESDASQDRGVPTVVVLPRSTAEVAAVVRVAHEQGLPIVPRGAGTGLSGGAVAVEGGVVLTTTRLNRIRRVDLANRIAVVEPGVVNAELTNRVASHGLYYAPDPSSQPACTIGGNVAENAGGAHCLAHGVTTNHVLALEAVLIPSGRVVRVGGPAPDRPGYDLMGLLVGSEGTLAIVTEITVRLLVRAEGVATVLAAFDGVVPASEAVSAIIGQGIVPVALEMMDGMDDSRRRSRLAGGCRRGPADRVRRAARGAGRQRRAAGDRASHLPSTRCPRPADCVRCSGSERAVEGAEVGAGRARHTRAQLLRPRRRGAAVQGAGADGADRGRGRRVRGTHRHLSARRRRERPPERAIRCPPPGGGRAGGSGR